MKAPRRKDRLSTYGLSGEVNVVLKAASATMENEPLAPVPMSICAQKRAQFIDGHERTNSRSRGLAADLDSGVTISLLMRPRSLPSTTSTAGIILRRTTSDPRACTLHDMSNQMVVEEQHTSGIGTAAEPRAVRRNTTWLTSSSAISAAMLCASNSLFSAVRAAVAYQARHQQLSIILARMMVAACPPCASPPHRSCGQALEWVLRRPARP